MRTRRRAPWRQHRSAASGRGDHRYLAADQIGRKRRQSIILAFRKVEFDRHVAAFHVAGLTQATAKRVDKVASVILSQAAQEADHRHRRLLRARRERPCDRRAAQKCDELAALLITSSARASTDDGTSSPRAFAVLRLLAYGEPS